MVSDASEDGTGTESLPPVYSKNKTSIVSDAAPSSVAGWSVATGMVTSANEMLRKKQMQDEAATIKATNKAVELEEECKRLRKELRLVNKRPRPIPKPGVHVI